MSTIGLRSNKKVVDGFIGRREILKKKTSTFVTIRNEKESYWTGLRLLRILVARLLPKLMFNSFWGKFGERLNKMKTVQCTQVHELLALLKNPLIDISTVRILSMDLLEVAYKRDDEDTDKGTKTNIFIAAFTTCQARLKLYESLEVRETGSCTTTPIQSSILGNLANLKFPWEIIWVI